MIWVSAAAALTALAVLVLFLVPALREARETAREVRRVADRIAELSLPIAENMRQALRDAERISSVIESEGERVRRLSGELGTAKRSLEELGGVAAFLGTAARIVSGGSGIFKVVQILKERKKTKGGGKT